jgi:succinate dehydrogenase hydrophobic anchor subunit
MATRTPTRPPASPPPSERPSDRGSRSWRFTAMTGVGVLILVTVHMVAHHFVVESVGGLRSYEQIAEYIGNPVIFVIEAIFLVFVTWHAMLGLRSVLFDLGLSTAARRFANRALTVLGILTVAYGLTLITVLALRG